MTTPDTASHGAARVASPLSSPLSSLLSALLAGLVFGLGLILAGMANPAKVLGFLGLAGAWYVVTQLFDFRFAPDPAIVGLTLLGGAGLSFLIGIAGSWPLLSAKPAQALRSL